MAPITDEQLGWIQDQIRAVSSPSISVTSVEVGDTDGADGPAVLVTVRLASTAAGAEWDPGDFRTIRRRARTVAVEALSGLDVRLVYESDSPADVSDEADEAGDKQAPEGEI